MLCSLTIPHQIKRLESIRTSKFVSIRLPIALAYREGIDIIPKSIVIRFIFKARNGACMRALSPMYLSLFFGEICPPSLLDSVGTGNRVDKEEMPPWDLLYRELRSRYGPE
jgi:hypothetical protein